MNSLKIEDDKFLLWVLQAFLKIQIFSQLSNVVTMEDRQRNLSWICLSLAKWACACFVWKWACVLHGWIRVKYKEAINTFKVLWAEHTQHLSGAERLDPEMRLHLSWLTRNQIGPTTKEKVEKDAWVFLKISSSYKFPSWESLLTALVLPSWSCRQAVMRLPSLISHCPVCRPVHMYRHRTLFTSSFEKSNLIYCSFSPMTGTKRSPFIRRSELLQRCSVSNSVQKNFLWSNKFGSRRISDFPLGESKYILTY